MNQKTLYNKAVRLIMCWSVVSILSSCSWFGGSSIPEISIDEYAAQHPFADVTLGTQKFDIYVDFSDGIVYAYNNESTRNHMLHLVNKVLQSANREKAFAMGQNKIDDISDLTSTQFYNKVIDKHNYRDIMAPIEQTLKAIVESNKLAILVTDFEEYTQDRRVQHQAYATVYFNAWLEKGGNIVFYAFPYREKGQDKHLYITLFDNSNHALEKDVQESFEGLEHNYIRFNLSNSSYTVATNYPAATKGGCNHDPKVLDDIISYTIEDGTEDAWHFIEGQAAEYYPFEESWEKIYKGAQLAIADYKDAPKTERADLIDYKYLLGNLSVDFSDMHAYTINNLEAVVYNIQEDIDAYAQYVADTNNYDPADTDDNGKPLPKPVYTPAAYTRVPDMLVFNGSIEEKVARVSIDFSPKFTGVLPSALENEQTIAVDIRIAQCQPDYSCINDLFFWGNNHSLEQSVRLTMQKFKPEGKTIYRYYINNK